MTRGTLGIDLGTSGVRAAVLSPVSETATNAIRLSPAARRDPAQLWCAVAGLLESFDLREVAAIAIAGTSGTLLALHLNGTPIGPLSLYSDQPDPDDHATVRTHAPRDSSAPALARALALQRRPGAERILHEADWIAGQLSGEFGITDENNALKSGYDPVGRTWPDWVQRAGLCRTILPSVLPPGARVGQVTLAASRRFGLPRYAIVAAGTTDGCASFLATGAHEVGDAVTALGSTTTLKLLATRPIIAPDYGVYSHRLGDLWLPGGASNAGAAVLARFFTPAQIASLSAQIDPNRPSPLDYLPLPAPGERFPVNNPALPPRLTPRPKDDAAFLHGLLEGIARVEALGYQRLAELGGPPLRRVLTTGGGAANPVWAAIRARLLGVPVEAANAEAAQGAAILARSAWLRRPLLPAHELHDHRRKNQLHRQWHLSPGADDGVGPRHETPM